MQRHRFFPPGGAVVDEIFIGCLKYALTINRKDDDLINRKDDDSLYFHRNCWVSLT